MATLAASTSALRPSWNAAAACPGFAAASSSSGNAFPVPYFWQQSSLVSRGHLLFGIGCVLHKASDQCMGSTSEGLRMAASWRSKLRAASSSTVQPVSQDGHESFIVPGADPGAITEWELDFCSRPILDERGKKLWELVVCDCKRRFQYARFYPNNVINSITLRDAILSIMQTLGLPKPQKIRFFRSQMQTIVSKACSELDIQPVPSQRCITLIQWLEERYESVYQHYPGFQEGAAPLLQLEQSMPLELPDALRGEQWAFVQLPLSGLLEEAAAVRKGSSFGSVFELDMLGIEIPPDGVVPGVAVASARATPLAAWTNALELSSLEVDRQRACLVLSTGVSDRWLYAFYQKSPQADQEATAWEAAKRTCRGLHFLAVQPSLDSDLCTGFWLLLDAPRSRI